MRGENRARNRHSQKPSYERTQTHIKILQRARGTSSRPPSGAEKKRPSRSPPSLEQKHRQKSRLVNTTHRIQLAHASVPEATQETVNILPQTLRYHCEKDPTLIPISFFPENAQNVGGCSSQCVDLFRP